ncbi:hypothetical protein L2E82_44636 [Cichorium intybus]|uniref:Uncharacterized protein n=1 Tax=Cichorium intybus TaxID=13427 RepID=A0ACB8ZS37_CICIN|nr:hypothetical protein L2E82_44636 [Cichorium intybus]
MPSALDLDLAYSSFMGQTKKSIEIWKALPFSSLYPFIYFTIRDFNLASQEEDIGYYAGFVVCREEYQGLALSTISSSRGIGIIIGPAIGGFFAQVSILFQAFDLSFVKTGEEWKKCQCYKKISILILQKKTRLTMIKLFLCVILYNQQKGKMVIYSHLGKIYKFNPSTFWKIEDDGGMGSLGGDPDLYYRLYL